MSSFGFPVISTCLLHLYCFQDCWRCANTFSHTKPVRSLKHPLRNNKSHFHLCTVLVWKSYTILCKSYYFKCLLHVISLLSSRASLYFPVLNFNRCLLGKHVLHSSRTESFYLQQSSPFYNTSCYHHSTPPTQRTHTSLFQRFYTITPQPLCRHRCKYSVIQSSIRTDAMMF